MVQYSSDKTTTDKV